MSSASSALTSSNMLFARPNCSALMPSQARKRASASRSASVDSSTDVVMSATVE
ncbi:hypothetical protein AHiyo8_55140 [Arthrobacter sp. Hiyo8]|nr:hypothetical protein AHiyo8_55140 [Arthrobacter sp. Hiyo8]